MGRYEAVKPVNPLSLISPKVTAGAVWGVAALVVLAIIDGITPAMFDSLGQWEGIARNLIGLAVSLLGAYLKTDPLRDLGAIVLSAPAVPEVTDVIVVAPAAAPVPEVAAPAPVEVIAEQDLRG